jgi:hypothetical protein
VSKTPVLVNHRKVCKMFDITTDVLLRAIRKGEWPIYHSTCGSFYLFDRSIIEHRLATGTWPSHAKFRPSREGAGRG